MTRYPRLLAACAVSAMALAAMTGGPVLAQEECDNTTPEEHVAIVHDLIAAVDAADLEAIDAILHDEYTDNANRHTLEADAASNADEHELAVMIQTLYPGSEHRVDEIRAVGDDQVVVAHSLIVHQHALTSDGSTAAVDEPVEMAGLSLYTFECGVITQGTTVTDLFGLLTGLGFQLTPPAS